MIISKAIQMNLSVKQKRNLNIATVLAVILMLWLLRPFFTVVIVAAIMAYLFIPVQKFFRKRFKRPGLATIITIFASFLVVVIPLILVILVSYEQVKTLIDELNAFLNSGTVVTTNLHLIDRINNFLGSVTNNAVSISPKQVQDFIVEVAKNASQFLLTFIANTFTSIPRLITNAIVFIYVYSALLTHHNKLIDYIKKLNPLGDEVAEVYLRKAGGMTSSMVRGQFLIAIAQGVIGALFLYMAGLHYFVLFALVLTVLSIIPLGGGIVAIPIGITMLFTGNITGGFIVLFGHFVVVTNIDNILRPLLVPKDLKFNSALLIVSVLAGVVIFGFIGIVIGPVLLALALATTEAYIAVKNQDSKAS